MQRERHKQRCEADNIDAQPRDGATRSSDEVTVMVCTTTCLQMTPSSLGLSPAQFMRSSCLGQVLRFYELGKVTRPTAGFRFSLRVLVGLFRSVNICSAAPVRWSSTLVSDGKNSNFVGELKKN